MIAQKTLWSAASVAAMACLLGSIINWHRGTRPVSVHTQRRRQFQQPPTDANADFLSSVSTLKAEPAISDDYTRDETCRKYLVNFLNGTTDAKDECQGFSNAWKAADCQDDKHVSPDEATWYSILDVFGLRKSHHAKNGTVLHDDVVIDDYYENWECCSSITDFYGKHCQQPELDSIKMLGIVMMLVICGFMKSMIRVTGFHWIPDAGACIIVGSIVGGLLRVFFPDSVKEKLAFDNDLFLQILLPPIIFQAAISIDKRAFRRDLFPVLTLAIFGTGFSAVVIGYLTYYLSAWGNGASLPILDSLLFGALMSSIDPVATLSILSGVGVGQSDTLYTLIFGESLLNDGVAIVLFNSLAQHMGDADDIDGATVHATIHDFVTVSLGSISIGVICGAMCTFYFWALQGKHNAVTEIAMFFTWALIPYYISDGFHFSGIISIMVMGFMIDYFVTGGFQNDEGNWMEYMELRIHPAGQHPVAPMLVRLQLACAKAFSGRGHLGPRSRHHVGFVAEVISNLMETAIFAYLGIFLLNDKTFNFKLVGSGLFSCVSSRAVMVIVTSILINICVWFDLENFLARMWYKVRRSNSRDDETLHINEKVYLDRKTQIILFSAGVRGAVSYALVQNIPVYDAVTKHGSKFKNELRTMTSSTIVVLLFTFGALTYFVVKSDSNETDEEQPASRPLIDRPTSSDGGLGVSLEVDYEPQRRREKTSIG